MLGDALQLLVGQAPVASGLPEGGYGDLVVVNQKTADGGLDILPDIFRIHIGGPGVKFLLGEQVQPFFQSGALVGLDDAGG